MTVEGGPVTLTEADIIEFARQYDPQPFHIDPVAAKHTLFGGLAGSGWHVAALSMRMLADSPLGAIANGLIGIELRSLRWPRPSRPGDILRLTVEILEAKPSQSRPGFGTALARWTTRNQKDETLLEVENVIWVARRPDH